MDLHDAGVTAAKYLIQDHGSKFTAAFDAVLTDSGITTIRTGIRAPRINTITERWIRACRTELRDRTLVWNQPHLLHALHEYEAHYNSHRPHHTLHAPAPPRPSPPPITRHDRLQHHDIQRRDRLASILHEYHHAA